MSGLIILIAAVVFLYLGSDVEGYDCKDGWIRHGNSCYIFIGTKETWMEAGQLCAAKGSTLAAIETADENAFLRGYLKVYDALGADMTAWIGGNDMEIEGTWKWSPSGELVTFTDWFTGEPRLSDGGDCMIMWHNRYDYRWGDEPCHAKKSFICETPVTPCTDPVIG